MGPITVGHTSDPSGRFQAARGEIQDVALFESAVSETSTPNVGWNKFIMVHKVVVGGLLRDIAQVDRHFLETGLPATGLKSSHVLFNVLLQLSE